MAKNTVHAGPLTADEIAAAAEAEEALAVADQALPAQAETLPEWDATPADEVTVKVTATASSKRKPAGKDKG